MELLVIGYPKRGRCWGQSQLEASCGRFKDACYEPVVAEAEAGN
jgi:hypothetical protein